MQRNVKFWASILSAGSLLAGMNASAATSIIADATARVVETLTITNLQPLTFGDITSVTGAGTVVIGTNNSRTINGGAQLAAGGFNRATFKVQGAPGSAYSIHTPGAQTFVSSQPAGSMQVATLTVNNFTIFSTTQASASSGRLDGTGGDTVYLGGTLTVPANAAPGIYSGMVPITVSY